MRPLDLIRKKRDGGELSSDEIGFLVRAYTNDEIPDYQMAAWLMAVLIRGMTGPELSALTAAMLHSGEVLDLSDLPGPKVDKHSTGGSATRRRSSRPWLRGRRHCADDWPRAGHTGGTLDKLQSIPASTLCR
jgi:thymidine phosphorylase